jgi:hypothetical protein
MSADLGKYNVDELKNLISTLENENTPLTKPKSKKVPKEETADIETVTIPVKQKKGWTAAKQESFKKVQEARRKQVEEIHKKKKLESAKVLLSELEIREKLETKPKKPVKQEPEEPDDEDDDNVEQSSSSSEEEIVIKKKSSVKKAKPVDKKKKKKTIIIQSESDDDSNSDDNDDEPPRPKKQREFKSARNKKSVIKVHGEKFNPDNFFV